MNYELVLTLWKIFILYKQKVENARPNQVTTNETNEGGGGI